jgi:hypothetical protein
MIFRFSDIDLAIELLQQHAVPMLDAAAFGIVDAQQG